jgi:hypothetical protein
MIAIVAALCFTAACDGDERKAGEKKYEVTIYVSDHIQGEIINVKPERKFTKPRIEIHAPEGVTIVPKETKPRRTTVVDFAPIALPVLIALLLIAALRRSRVLSFSFSQPDPNVLRPYTSADSSP